jgi:hypothetical protein
MKKRYWNAFLLCLLCAAMLLSPIGLMSCKDNQDDGPTPPAASTSFVLAGEGAENPYVVVRSDEVHSGSKISIGAATLRKAIGERFGSMEITTDWTGAGGTPEGEFEILVGPTNRAESGEVIKDLGVNEFIIRMIGKKLVIVASSEAGITSAVNYFVETYVNTQTTSLKIPETLNYKGEYTVFYEVPSAGGSGAAKYDTAMALANVGDVSEPVLTSSGVHIIYYNSDVTPGAVDIETIRDALAADALTVKQDNAYTEQYEAWKSEANVKKYPKVLG